MQEKKKKTENKDKLFNLLCSTTNFLEKGTREDWEEGVVGYMYIYTENLKLK